MSKPKVFILRAAGTNCDYETEHVFKKVGAQTQLVHINHWLKHKELIHEFNILVIPGGFTYGDDIAAGIILATELKYHLAEEIIKFIQDKKLIMGICNGFQVLVKLGLLPGIDFSKAKRQNASQVLNQTVTLTWNDSGRYDDRWVYLKKASRKCVFTKGLSRKIIYLPIAHAEGKFIPKDNQTLQQLKKNDQIVFQYADQQGRLSKQFPINPNGSVANIAGICDPTGRILGMMPHPERFNEIYNHPRWTRENVKEPTDGMLLFHNAVNYIKKHL